MQQGFGIILLALDKGQPRVMGVRQLIQCYIDHRKEVVIRRTRFELAQAEARQTLHQQSDSIIWHTE